MEPVLTRLLTESIEDIKPADHIVEGSSHHWLVKTVDAAKSTFKGFTCSHSKGKVTLKEVVWKSKKFFRIEYPKDSTESKEVSLKRAQTEFELDQKSEWDESDKFITEMKLGKPYTITEQCVMKYNREPVSSTPITPHVIVKAGDHLLVKMEGGNYHSILVEVVVDANTVVCSPNPNGEEVHGYFMVAETEAYRVNYTEHLPPDTILVRAESDEGQRILQSCRHDSSLFVSWAITGKQTSVKAEELIKKQELKLVRPTWYKRITPQTCDKIQLGDHLFVDRLTYRWHFMVTEICDEPNVFKAVYYSNGSMKETVETINPSKLKVYKVMYAEEFAPEVAIKRARSRVGEIKVDLWARVEFVRWAKTGSNEGVEVDFMTNSSCLLYTSPSPRDATLSRMPSSA